MRTFDKSYYTKTIYIDPERGALMQNKIVNMTTELGAILSSDPCTNGSNGAVYYGGYFRSETPPEIKLAENCHSTDSFQGIMVALHELGHVIDYRAHDSDFSKYIQSGGTHQIEIQAWLHAFRLAHKVGFTLNEFDILKEYALSSLFTYFGKEEGPPNRVHLDDRCSYYGPRPEWPYAYDYLVFAHRAATRKLKKVLFAV